MERARILWSEIAPGPVLLGAGGLAAAVAATAFAGQPEAVFERTLRLSADEIRAAVQSADVPSTLVAEVDAGTEVPSGEIDFDLGLEGPAEEPASGSLDFDLDLASEAPAEKDASTISTVDLEVLPDEMMASALAEATQALDLDLTEESAQESAERPSGSLDFDLEETFEPSAAAAGDSPSGAREPSVDLALEPLSVSGGKTALAGTPPVGLAAAPTGKTPPAQVEETGFDLEPGPREAGAADSTETQAEPTSTSTGARAEEAAAESEVAGLDLALEPLETSSGSSRGPTIVPSEGIPEEVLATLASGSRAAAVAAAGAGKAAPSEVDFELDLDLGGGDADESSFFLEGEGIGLLDEVGTKLDLARAYIDMGDTEGARGILSEVLSEGNDVQRLEARDLLGKLAS
jgi:pilus assembly protein FimV